MKFPEIRETIANNPNFLNVKNLELTPRELGLSPMGSFIFTKRAVLNVGFMLEQSQVALEVRKTFEITKVKELLKAFMFASNGLNVLQRLMNILNGLIDTRNNLKKRLKSKQRLSLTNLM